MDSFLLLMAFSVAMVFYALLVHLLAVLIIRGLTTSYPTEFVTFVTWAIAAAVWVPVLVSSYKRWRDVQNGGFLEASLRVYLRTPDRTLKSGLKTL